MNAEQIIAIIAVAIYMPIVAAAIKMAVDTYKENRE